MDEPSKRRFDSILALYQRAWDQFNERRKYEVQVSLAFWTALVLAIAGSLNLSTFPQLPGGRASLVALCVAVVGIHAMWHLSIWRSNRRDRARAIDYQQTLHTLTSFKYGEATQQSLDAAQAEQTYLLSNPSHRFQLTLTALLALSLLLVNWTRFERPPMTVQNPATTLQLSRDSVALETERLRLYLLRQDSTRTVRAPVRR